MKGIQINPYHSVAIYDNDNEASLQGSLYSPADALPPMQFETEEQSPVAHFSLVRVSDGAIYAQDASDWDAFDHGGGRFHTYFGAPLSSAVPDGIYRARIELANNAEYWSHALCCSQLFSAPADPGFSLLVSMCGEAGGMFTFEMEATGADYVDVYVFQSPVYVFQARHGLEFQITGSTASPLATHFFKILLSRDYEAENGGRVTVRSEYTLTVFSTNPCSAYTLNPAGISSLYGEELAYLEWWEANDRQTQGILYQEQHGGAYRQRFYGKFWRAAPAPSVENVFIVDGSGRLTRQSSATAETLALECWPVPDYAFTVLANAGNHESIQFSNMGGSPAEVDRLEFSTAAIGEDDRHKGIFALTFNTAYVSGCQEDYEQVFP